MGEKNLIYLINHPRIHLFYEILEKNNLEKINEYMDVSESIKEDTKKKKQIEEKMKDITDKFYKINVQNKKKDIENFYRSRVEKTKRCREILKNIDNLEESQKVILRGEYISLIKNLNTEYIHRECFCSALSVIVYTSCKKVQCPKSCRPIYTVSLVLSPKK